MPVVVPLSNHVRIIGDDQSYVSLEDVYEDYCENNGTQSDEVVVHFRDAMASALKKYNIALVKGVSA